VRTELEGWAETVKYPHLKWYEIQEGEGYWLKHFDALMCVLQKHAKFGRGWGIRSKRPPTAKGVNAEYEPRRAA
jgi:hypothetical protein